MGKCVATDPHGVTQLRQTIYSHTLTYTLRLRFTDAQEVDLSLAFGPLTGSIGQT